MTAPTTPGPPTPSAARTSPANSSPPGKPTPIPPGRRRRWTRSTSSTPPPHRARAQNLTQIPPDVGDPLLHRWKHALLCGLADNPRRHGLKQSKTRNLLTRLTTRDEQVLLFARDLRVGFTNNQAERDLRPAKTQLKISGCHRSSSGAQAWLRIRGYISTMRKNGVPVLPGLRDAITGNPWTPAAT